MINELKKVLVGKTIKSIDEGYGEACIFQITYMDPKKDPKESPPQTLKIHANDLGQWFKHINKTEDNVIVCNSLKELFIEFNDYIQDKCNYNDDLYYKVGVTLVRNEQVLLKWFDTEQIFKCPLNHEWEFRVSNHEDFFNLVRDAIALGPLYKAIFVDELTPPDDYE